ncbi:MAG: hypothetical protein MUD02_10185 [Bacteroidales bacterium]|nr:hypothetical protein [Bacteroidales bacterium]
MAGSSGNIPKVSVPVPVGAVSAVSAAARSVAPSLSSSPSSIITAGIMNALISNLFAAPDPKAQQAAIDAQKAEEARQAMEAEHQRQLREAMEREKYDNMMKMYKSGPGSGDLEIKDETNLDFKTLDGDAEAMARGARDQFEAGSLSDMIPEIEGGTDFFGIDVSSPEFTTLTDPDNDPNVVDLRKAEGIIDNGIAKEEAARAKDMKKDDAAKTDKAKTPEFCAEMQKKLDGFTETRARFQKTIDMTRSELSKWHEQNNGALLNSAKSGATLVSEIFLKHIDLRKTGAENIRKFLIDYPGASPAMVDNYISVLDKVISYKKTFAAVDYGKKALEWATLARDESQVIANEIARDDRSVLAMLNDPTVKKVLNDGRPFVDAEQSFVSKSIEIFLDGPEIQKKLVSAFSKTMPVVAWCQFAVDQTYNATDWVLSYNRICDFNNVSGKEAEAAQYLQDKISEIRISMNGCPSSGL